MRKLIALFNEYQSKENAKHVFRSMKRSIADITFNWSRLTWPALAQRHAAPWSRKISATSNAGRDTVGGGYAGGCSCLFLSSVFLGFLRFGRASRSSGLLPLFLGFTPSPLPGDRSYLIRRTARRLWCSRSVML